MSTYLRPGVFVEETLTALADPNADSSDSIAAFVGVSDKGGPLGPTLITSWSQYVSLFGPLTGTGSDLGFAVYSFFNNGGSQCYIARAANADATPAHLALNDSDSDGSGSDTAEPCLQVTATSPGSWASDPDSTNRIYVTVQNSATSGRFDLIIEVGTGAGLVAREQFVDLTLDPNDGRNAINIVNSATIGSKYVTLTQLGTWGPDGSNDSTVGNPASVTKVPLVAGSDGTGDPDLVAAAQTLDLVDNILLVNVPGLDDATQMTSIINWAENAQNRFVVVDIPRPDEGADATTVMTDAQTFVQGLPSSSYAAVYGPWLYLQDPSSRVSGALRLTAPGGAVLGQYARNDVLNGVQKVPAGISTTVKAVNTQAKFLGTQLDTLNQSGINVIRSVPGSGVCIMGGRTLATGTPDRYINIRRTLIYLKRSLVSLSRFAIFEPNDESTWETIEAVLEQFLTNFWQSGGLRGSTADQAFYVTCDSTNNTAADIAAGVLNIDVGVALETPAEFIVIRIGQYDGGSTTTDDSAGSDY